MHKESRGVKLFENNKPSFNTHKEVSFVLGEPSEEEDEHTTNENSDIEDSAANEDPNIKDSAANEDPDIEEYTAEGVNPENSQNEEERTL